MIRYQFTVEDIRRVNEVHARLSARRFADPTPSKLYWWVLVPSIIVGLAVFSGSFGFAAVSFFLFWGASAITARWERRRYLKAFYNEENVSASLVPFQLELLADRLTLSSADLIHHHFWHSFRVLRESTDFFHLFFTPISSMDVPKSAFSSAEERDAFRTVLKSHEPSRPVRAVK